MLNTVEWASSWEHEENQEFKYIIWRKTSLIIILLVPVSCCFVFSVFSAEHSLIICSQKTLEQWTNNLLKIGSFFFRSLIWLLFLVPEFLGLSCSYELGESITEMCFPKLLSDAKNHVFPLFLFWVCLFSTLSASFSLNYIFISVENLRKCIFLSVN